MTISTAQGRYFIQDSPQASPGVCVICGYGGSERKYLDPRLDFDEYGSVIFCNECVMSMAQQFGYIEPAQARALEQRVEEAERELVTLRAAVLNLENLSDSLSALGFNSGLSGVSTVVSSGSEGADELPQEPDSGTDQPELPFTESADEPGSDDVRDTPVHKYDPFADLRS